VTDLAFEHVEEVDQAVYAKRNGPTSTGKRSRRGRVYAVALPLVAVAFLFSPYTFSVGVLALIISVIVWTFPRWSSAIQRRTFNETKYLRGLQTYGVSDQGFWIRTPTLTAESTWENLAVWDEHEGILRLSGSGMPPLYLPTEKLRTAGVYDGLVALARKHGQQFKR
jgi:hypothetical protein